MNTPWLTSAEPFGGELGGEPLSRSPATDSREGSEHLESRACPGVYYLLFTVSNCHQITLTLFINNVSSRKDSSKQWESEMKTGAVFLFIAVTSCFVSGAGAEEFAVKVAARSHADIVLLTRMIRDVYPLLDPDQQQLVRDGLIFRAAKRIGGALAYGPEDDPDYRYPDQTLYPSGTIKVNFAPSFVELIRKFYKTPKVFAPQAQHIAYAKLVEVVAHEIKHVEQYMKNPVLALARREDCPAGLCDEAKLEATQKKLEYELEATIYGRRKYYEVRSEEQDRVLLPQDVHQDYRTMYEPPMLVKKCVANMLTTEDRLLAEYYLPRLASGSYAEEYPYLPVVTERLKTCLRKQGE